MGWDGIPINNKFFSKDDEWAEISLNITDNYKILANTKIKSVWYFVCKCKSDGRIFAGVVLTKREKGWFYSKMMIETEGPCFYDMPMPYLKMLTEPENHYAAEWRMECIKNKTGIKLSCAST